jgi:predicted nucleic acid-binding protein
MIIGVFPCDESNLFLKGKCKKRLVHFTYKSIQATIIRNRRLRVEREDNGELLASTMEAKADSIVSRDPHLRNLRQFHGIGIIGVKELVKRVKKG